jgi:tripartite ATP-independent transporter DctP family solute receptor
MKARFGLLAGIVFLMTWAGSAWAADVRLRAAHESPAGTLLDYGHQFFAKRVGELSGGRMVVEVFPGGQLGSEVAMVEGVRLGSIDVTAAQAANMATVVPELGLFSVSYLFRDKEHYDRVLNDPKFQRRVEELVASRNVNLKIIGFYGGAMRSVYVRTGPVRTPDDLKGLKLRVMNNPIESRIWKAFGAIPTPMNFAEVYSALQTGVIDGGETIPSVMETSKLYQPAKFVSLTEHQFTFAPLVINEKRFASLPSDLQKIVLDAGREASAVERKQETSDNIAAVNRVRTLGANIVEPDKVKFQAAVASIHDDVARELKVTDLLQMIRDAAR